MYICTYGYMDLCICIYIYIQVCIYIYVNICWVARVWLKTGGSRGGGGARQGAQISEIRAREVCFLKKTSQDPVGIQSGKNFVFGTMFGSLIPHLLPKPTLAPIFLFRSPAVHQYPPLLHQKCRMYMFIYVYIYIYGWVNQGGRRGGVTICM